MSQGRRLALGAHYTPPELARRIVHMAFERWEANGTSRHPVVCDPSCGGGAVLLAAAEALLDRGVPAGEVLRSHLVGLELDRSSAAAARLTLVGWARDNGVGWPAPPMIVQADALRAPLAPGAVDVMVGNPPFASPLRSRVESLGDGVGGAYVDASALHLLAALRATSPGGITCLLQPQSLLGARDATAVREEVSGIGVMESFWASDEDFFDTAAVRVCAPVFRRRRPTQLADPPWHTSDPSSVGPASVGPASGGPTFRGPTHGGPVSGGTTPVQLVWRNAEAGVFDAPIDANWAPLLSTMAGAPVVTVPDGAVMLSTVAHCTAGFRDEFYSLGAVAAESSPGPCGRYEEASGLHRLVTSGMIDPGFLRWGRGTFRLAGVGYSAPVADPHRLAEHDARVHRWAARRRVPKVLVASQTKAIEAVCDRDGGCVPVTPVVSVEPLGGISPAALAAMMSAPSSTAALWAMAAGTGRNTASMRVTARSIGDLPVLSDPQRCVQAAELWSELESMAETAASTEGWVSVGIELDRLVGHPGERAVALWWVERLPRRLIRGG